VNFQAEKMSFIDFCFAISCIWLVIFIILLFIMDGDLSLMFHAKFGRKIYEMKDKVIWITGASTGIGAACAIQCAKVGAKLVLSARNETLLWEIKQKCLDAGRAEGLTEKDVLVLPLDLTKLNNHQSRVNAVLDHFGKIDVMLHNAGRSQRARWEHTDIQVDKDLFELNVFSIISLSRCIMPHFLKRNSGIFAIMSSSAGKAGVPYSGTYTGSKHALHGYFESLRTEKMATGISVVMLCPGPTFSNLLAVAATENPGEDFNESMRATDKRMTSERCAFLSLVAIAHKLEEAWLCFFPVLPLMYISQYLPTIGKRVMSMLGPKFMANVRDSRQTIKDE